jgi:hypothetical protein
MDTRPFQATFGEAVDSRSTDTRPRVPTGLVPPIRLRPKLSNPCVLIVREARMEFWGLGLLLALWRYFREVDWDVRVKRKPSKKART